MRLGLADIALGQLAVPRSIRATVLELGPQTLIFLYDSSQFTFARVKSSDLASQPQ